MRSNTPCAYHYHKLLHSPGNYNKILTVNMSQTNEYNLVFIGFTLTQFDMLNNRFGYCYPRTRKIIRSHNSRINLNSHKKQNNIIITITTSVWTTQQQTTDTNISDHVSVSLSLAIRDQLTSGQEKVPIGHIVFYHVGHNFRLLVKEGGEGSHPNEETTVAPATIISRQQYLCWFDW